jgi:hypothetical protein
VLIVNGGEGYPHRIGQDGTLGPLPTSGWWRSREPGTGCTMIALGETVATVRAFCISDGRSISTAVRSCQAQALIAHCRETAAVNR